VRDHERHDLRGDLPAVTRVLAAELTVGRLC